MFNYPRKGKNQPADRFPSGFIKIDVFNIRGELIDKLGNEYIESGIHNKKWEPERIASGIYLLRFIHKETPVIQSCLYLR